MCYFLIYGHICLNMLLVVELCVISLNSCVLPPCYRSVESLGTLPPATALGGIPTALTAPCPPSLPFSSTPAIAPLPTVPSTSSPSPTTSLAPLVLSPSLPPVPGKLVAKIRSGAFIPLKELLGDNIALHQRLEEMNGGPASQPWWVSAAHPHMRPIRSPLQWVYTMLLYIAVRCPDEPTRQLVTYTRLVLHLAQKHGGSGWLDYDHTFRAQAASSPGTAWNAINPSLMASAVLSSTSMGTFCHLCQEVDHQATDCALAALDPSPNLCNQNSHCRSLPQPSAKRVNRPSPYDLSVEVCRRFNWGQCPDPNVCRFRHVCSYADCKRTTHGAIVCPLRPETAKAGPSPPQWKTTRPRPTRSLTGPYCMGPNLEHVRAVCPFMYTIPFPTSLHQSSALVYLFFFFLWFFFFCPCFGSHICGLILFFSIVVVEFKKKKAFSH